ncbi:MAG: hypothetical protein ACI8W8_003636 [Rhodothermales bacterium]|jgi:hypothetical protein
MNRNIYTISSPAVHERFSPVPADKIILVPVDFAKEKHVGRLCLGNGDYTHKKALTIYNDIRGVEFLDTKIKGACQRLKIHPCNVIIAGEDCLRMPPTSSSTFAPSHMSS